MFQQMFESLVTLWTFSSCTTVAPERSHLNFGMEMEYVRRRWPSYKNIQGGTSGRVDVGGGTRGRESEGFGLLVLFLSSVRREVSWRPDFLHLLVFRCFLLVLGGPGNTSTRVPEAVTPDRLRPGWHTTFQVPTTLIWGVTGIVVLWGLERQKTKRKKVDSMRRVIDRFRKVQLNTFRLELGLFEGLLGSPLCWLMSDLTTWTLLLVPT